MYKGTGVFDTLMREQKKEVHMGDFKALHTIHRWVSVDKYCVITTRSLPSGLHCMYVFTMHATDSRNVTWCMEYSNSGRIDSYFSIEGGEICRDCVGSIVGMLLVVDKLWYKIRKVRLSNFGSDIFWISVVHCKHR
jgi:hypothetical protein